MGLSEQQCLALKQMPPLKEAVFKDGDKRIILATYRGDVRTLEDGPHKTLPLRTAAEDIIKKAGDELRVLSGRYWPTPSKCLVDHQECNPEPIVIENIEGEPDNPIVIRGYQSRPLLVGGTTPAPYWWKRPSTFFKFVNCKWIVVEGFSVQDCWPIFAYLQDSSYITIRDIHAVGSTYLIWAQGECCHHLLFEDNVWRQDPTGVLWNELLWLDVHDREYQYLDGGFFGSKNITGSVVLRRNVVRDAYNAVRMKADPSTGLLRQNLNVEIYDNDFDKLRDNAVEPEEAATNWYIYHNRFCDIHAPISMDRVACGYFFVFGNLAWFTDQPGQMIDEYTGGKFYKMKTKPPYPTEKKVFAFNNSLFLNNKVIKKGKTQYFSHLNNAVQFCNPDEYPGCICLPVNNFIGRDFTEIEKVVFDYDITNGTMSRLIQRGQEENGICDPEFKFLSPKVGDLHPADGYDMPPGTVVKLLPEEDWAGPYEWESLYDGKPPQRGAWQSEEELIEGPPFAFYEPKEGPRQYQERPRIVRVERSTSHLVIFFSTPLHPESPLTIRISHPVSGENLDLKAVIDRNRLIVKFGRQKINWVAQADVLIPPHLCAQETKQPITAWASVDKKIIIGQRACD